MNPDQTLFSITKLMSFNPKFKEAFTMSSFYGIKELVHCLIFS